MKRTPRLTGDNWDRAKRLLDEDDIPVSVVARRFGVTYAAVYNRRKADKPQPRRKDEE